MMPNYLVIAYAGDKIVRHLFCGCPTIQESVRDCAFGVIPKGMKCEYTAIVNEETDRAIIRAIPTDYDDLSKKAGIPSSLLGLMGHLTIAVIPLRDPSLPTSVKKFLFWHKLWEEKRVSPSEFSRHESDRIDEEFKKISASLRGNYDNRSCGTARDGNSGS